MTAPSTPGPLLAWRQVLVTTLLCAALGNAIGQVPSSTGGVSIQHLDVGEFDEISLAQERQIGDAYAKELLNDPDYLDDPILGDLVKPMMQRLITAARAEGLLSQEMYQAFAWEVFLGKDKSINAFATSGGYFGLHLGLIATTHNPSELASVLAHELSHVLQRHISRSQAQQRRAAPLVMGTLLAGAALARKSDALGQAALIGGQALGVQTQLNYSREMEREADRVGFNILTKAGYAPQGFVTFFEKLQNANRLSDDNSFPYLRTHPLTTERMASMQSRTQPTAAQTGGNGGVSAPTASVSGLAYALLAARAKSLMATELDAQKGWADQAQAPQLAQQVIERQVSALVVGSHYLAATGQFERASALLVRLQSLVQHDAQALAIAMQLRAELALSQGRWQEAYPLLQDDKQVQWVGLGGQRTHTLFKAQAQIGMGFVPQAIDRLQLWLANHPGDAKAWQTLAQAYERQGHPLRQLRASAEAQLAQKDAQGALDRLRSARQLSTPVAERDAHDLDLVIVQARIDAITEQIKRSTPRQ